MSKAIGRMVLWLVGALCITLICVKNIYPVTETELINSENYLVTSELNKGDMIEQSITLQRVGLEAVEVAFVYGGNTTDECKALIEILANEKVLMQSVVQVNLMPNQNLTTFEIPRGIIGYKLSLRITNVSKVDSNTGFSFFYTNSEVRMLEHVALFEINNQVQNGQLISRYTYRVGYNYYTALSAAFLVFLLCMTLETVLFKKCKVTRFENYKYFHERIILLIILLLAFLSRFCFLASWPDGAMQDEAYGAYNAYGLLTEGIDSRGYSFPAYFVAWGSGMSVLYSYLAIPFFKIFGVCLWAYRLPQVIVSFCSVIAIYIACKELFSKKMGLFLAFVLAINPWSIMNARFGLDANMAPGMFIIGFCFLILGIRKSSKYMIPAAIFLGLTLYCYALSWIMIPIFLVLCLVFYWKYIPFDRYTWIAIGSLFLIALPLILFVAINLGFVPEIKTEFISIPKLDGFRGNEMSLVHIGKSLKDTIKTVIFQYDGADHTSNKVVGAYYLFTTPFFIFGVINHLAYTIRRFKVGQASLDSIWLLWMISGMIICVLNYSITIIHINLIHLPVIFYSGYGIWKFLEFIGNSKIILGIDIFFVISFVIFVMDYTTTEQASFSGSEINEVLEEAKELAQGEKTIYIYQENTINYAILLWHELPRVSDFCENVVYDPTFPPEWQYVLYYDGFRYITDISQTTNDGIYIMFNQFAERFQLAGFKTSRVNSLYSVGWQ